MASLKTLVHHSNIVWRGFSGALTWAPTISRDASLSYSQYKILQSTGGPYPQYEILQSIEAPYPQCVLLELLIHNVFPKACLLELLIHNVFPKACGSGALESSDHVSYLFDGLDLFIQVFALEEVSQVGVCVGRRQLVDG